MVEAGFPILRIDDLCKRFGGLQVTSDVKIHLQLGETLALIGPNGAGKTTLLLQLIGELRQDSGSIWLDEQEITRLAVPERARIGIARTFQITTIIPTFTAVENVALAVQARAGHSFRFWRAAAADASLREPAYAAIAQVGLENCGDVLASRLSHGQLRQLEIAIALAMQPRILLLDEPLAGMSGADSVRMVELLRSLKRQFSVMLVEHDMTAVFDLADRIAVLVGGKVIATGIPQAIRNNPEVRQAYLGDEVLSRA